MNCVIQFVTQFIIYIIYFPFSNPQAKPLESFTQLSRDCTLTVPDKHNTGDGSVC